MRSKRPPSEARYEMDRENWAYTDVADLPEAHPEYRAPVDLRYALQVFHSYSRRRHAERAGVVEPVGTMVTTLWPALDDR